MKILIAPLNWGLGHATRCIPLIRQYLNQGANVILGGTGDSLELLHKHFNSLPCVELAPLHLKYSAGKKQMGVLLRSLPQFIRFYCINRRRIREIVQKEQIDLVISDNCFGVYTNLCDCIYITHQLNIRLPYGWQWAQPIARLTHAHLYTKYKEIWVPDHRSGNTLSGWLGHPAQLDRRVKYIGPLSRFSPDPVEEGKRSNTEKNDTRTYSIVAVLSGLEPQRSIFEQEIIQRFEDGSQQVLIVRGKIGAPMSQFIHKNITFVPYLDDEALKRVLYTAKRIIARSGYSTIMDLWSLGLLSKAELHPTPGQPEQEYLAHIHHSID